jgi:peptidoglycan/xylan/chitin deacetylase (PgdA/CDA1 family)
VTAYRHIQGWRYPDGVRLAVNFTVDFDAQLFRRVLNELPLELAQGEFGGRTGIWRLLELFDRHRIGLTIFTPGRIAELYPASLREAARCGFEIANHMWEHDRYAGGALSPHTVDLLIDAGYQYLGNGLADDIPHYWVTDAAARRCLLAMPYYYQSDDQFFLMFPAPGRGSALERPAPLRANWLGELEATRAFGRCFAITIHPRLIAWGGRLTLLEEVLASLQSGPRVWTTTALACARWFATAYPASTALRLEPSIWQDHPGSLS